MATAVKSPAYSPMEMIRAFHAAFKQKRFIEEPDALGRRKSANLRLRLISEEFREVADELLDVMNGHGDRMKLAKELADLLYVVYGTADVFEIPLEEVHAAVHESNMSKLGADGKPVVRASDGKILKGPNYREPDLTDIMFGKRLP